MSTRLLVDPQTPVGDADLDGHVACGSIRSGGTPDRLLPITGDRHKGEAIDVEKGRYGSRWLREDDDDDDDDDDVPDDQNKLSTSRFSKVIVLHTYSTDRHTYAWEIITTPSRRFAGDKNSLTLIKRCLFHLQYFKR